jgi:hypothetical protein
MRFLPTFCMARLCAALRMSPSDLDALSLLIRKDASARFYHDLAFCYPPPLIPVLLLDAVQVNFGTSRPLVPD